MKFFSPSTLGFYDADVHGPRSHVLPARFDKKGEVTRKAETVTNPDTLIPSDAFEISDDEHAALIAGNAAGKRIGADKKGRPVLFDTEPTPTEAAALARDLARTLRGPALAVLDGMQASANAKALGAMGKDTKAHAAAVAEAMRLESIKQAWREMPALNLGGKTSYPEMEAAVLAAIAEVAKA